MNCVLALDTEGIFRVPGSVAEVNELIRAYDEGKLNCETLKLLFILVNIFKPLRQFTIEIILSLVSSFITLINLYDTYTDYFRSSIEFETI